MLIRAKLGSLQMRLSLCNNDLIFATNEIDVYGRFENLLLTMNDWADQCVCIEMQKNIEFRWIHQITKVIYYGNL